MNKLLWLLFGVTLCASLFGANEMRWNCSEWMSVEWQDQTVVPGHDYEGWGITEQAAKDDVEKQIGAKLDEIDPVYHYYSVTRGDMTCVDTHRH